MNENAQRTAASCAAAVHWAHHAYTGPTHPSTRVHDVGGLVNHASCSHGSCREAHTKQPAGALEAVTDVAFDGRVLQELETGRGEGGR